MTSVSVLAGPRVTVAIPVFNSEQTLERCVRSAMGQTMRDLEILIADDASTDGSAALAERLAAEDPRIKVLRLSSNGGKPRAMNAMVWAARGDWIAVLDADDAYHASRLECLVAAAEAAGAAMAADNILYVDAGADQAVRTAFPSGGAPRALDKADMIANSDSYAEFDFGILKPVMLRSFLLAHGLAYYEETRLSEDFYYLLSFFVAGGTGVLVGEPLYYWTMPFGTISRRWTGTAAGAWRYDYRGALLANEHFIAAMDRQGEAEVVIMLRARSAQYRVMTHYLDAQRLAAEGAWPACAATIASHPGTWPLLVRRVLGRVRRGLQSNAMAASGGLPPHPSLRPDAAAARASA